MPLNRILRNGGWKLSKFLKLAMRLEVMKAQAQWMFVFSRLGGYRPAVGAMEFVAMSQPKDEVQ